VGWKCIDHVLFVWARRKPTLEGKIGFLKKSPRAALDFSRENPYNESNLLTRTLTSA
jgi:hypothetical protein